jgi:hypothetical protein
MVDTLALGASTARCGGSSPLLGTKNMKLYEATIREPGPGTEERKVRIGAESAEEARRLLQQLYGPRSVPYLPRVVPS